MVLLFTPSSFVRLALTQPLKPSFTFGLQHVNVDGTKDERPIQKFTQIAHIQEIHRNDMQPADSNLFLTGITYLHRKELKGMRGSSVS